MEVKRLEADSDRWMRLLAEVRHDVYHLPSYLAFAARRQEPGEPYMFVVRDGFDRLLVPLIVRPIPPEIAGDELPRFDATSPRGYPGPILAMAGPASEDTFVDRAIEALGNRFLHDGIVSAFVRLHPLFALPQDALRRQGEIVDHGDSVFVDLTLSEDVLRSQTRHGHRQDLNRATRLGYTARIDDRWERFDAFVDIFQESMERVGATPYWRLTREYFTDLRDSLAGNLHLCVVELDDEVAAAGLLTEVDGIVEYHLAGTADAHLRASPSKLVVNFARWWGKQRGNRVLHLTGSLRRGDSLSHFKVGFSPLHRRVFSWRFIADQAEYFRLADAWRDRHSIEPDPIESFFPSYRKLAPEAD